MSPRLPCLFVTHGGGPLPLLGDALHAPLIKAMKGTAALLPERPKAIVLVTAHWETSWPTVSTCPRPSMLYDYGGFPPESYQIQYPAPGSPTMAARVKTLLKNAGIQCLEDAKRGFDHGTFVPLKLAFPEADIPVVQMSIMESMDPRAHIEVGRALSPLRDEGVLIMASGSSFHNMRGFMAVMGGIATGKNPIIEAGKEFDTWLHKACTENTGAEREQMLQKWDQAPGGRMSHPREEHFIPLLVVAGAAGSSSGRSCLKDTLRSPGAPKEAGLPVSSFIFG